MALTLGKFNKRKFNDIRKSVQNSSGIAKPMHI